MTQTGIMRWAMARSPFAGAAFAVFVGLCLTPERPLSLTTPAAAQDNSVRPDGASEPYAARSGPRHLSPHHGSSAHGSPSMSGNGNVQFLRPLAGGQGGVIEVERIHGPGVYRPEAGSETGLGEAAWAGVPFSVIEALVAALPVGAPSPAMGELIRKVLLTPAPAADASSGLGFVGAEPADPQWNARFLSLRLNRLQEAGHIEDAEAIADELTGSPGVDTIGVRIQAVSSLLDGDHEQACDYALRMRLTEESTDPFWIKLRTFCYVLDDAGAAAGMTARLLTDDGHNAPLFYALIQYLTTKEPIDAEAWKGPVDVLNYAMIRHGGVEIPLDAVLNAEPVVLRAIAMDLEGEESDRDLAASPVLATKPSTALAGTVVREVAAFDLPVTITEQATSAPLSREAYLRALAAAEISVLTGALEPGALAHAFRSARAPDAAVAEPLKFLDSLRAPAVNALLYQVVDQETVPAVQVELVNVALQRARASDSLIPVALVYGDLVAGIQPTPDLAWAGAQLGIAALVAGQYDAAYRWRDMMARAADINDRDGTSGAPMAEALRRINVALAIAAPRDGIGFAPRLDIDRWIEAADAGRIDPQRLQVELEILAALGQGLSPAARAWLFGRPALGPVALPAASLIDALDIAVENRRLAEAVSLAMIGIGREGPEAKSPFMIQRAVRALFRLGLDGPARRLALETLLARPA